MHLFATVKFDRDSFKSVINLCKITLVQFQSSTICKENSTWKSTNKMNQDMCNCSIKLTNLIIKKIVKWHLTHIYNKMCKINSINQNWLSVCGYKIISVTSMLQTMRDRQQFLQLKWTQYLSSLVINWQSKFYNAIKQQIKSTNKMCKIKETDYEYVHTK